MYYQNLNNHQTVYIFCVTIIYSINVWLIYYDNMAKIEKLIRKILSGQSDANIKFNDVVRLLLHLGFEMRTKGSHNIFRKDGVNEQINIQKDGNKAKPYQIRQIRSILIEYNLTEDL
jgi:predicted RNA binding protein YcfA (HicA-like mRNA interferase family)